jgi:hypothetical protein
MTTTTGGNSSFPGGADVLAATGHPGTQIFCEKLIKNQSLLPNELICVTTK